MPRNNNRRDRRNILGRNEAVKLLDPVLDELIEASREGLAHFAGETAEQMLPYRNRTKANMLNDAIVHHAKLRLSGTAGVIIDESCDGTFFVLQQMLALRFKKLDANDATANIKTKRQRAVDGQVLEFEGIRQPTIVSFGYTLAEFWTDIIDIKVFCQVNGRREWTIPLVKSVHSPMFDISNEQFDEGPRVRSRRKSADNNGETA